MGATAAVHPADPILQAYGLGKLDDSAFASVSKHLEECDSCQRRVAGLSSDDFLGRLRKVGVMPDKATSGWSPSAASSTEGAARTTVPPPRVDTLPPELVDHPDYELVRELGRGGMGVVYLAQNKLMGRPEVLKFVGGHLAERPGVADRFLREIRSAAKLHHANIVTAYSALRLRASLVLAMEYVKGLDLAKIVKTEGPLSIAHACYFIHQAALGLQHAHERGMVHRDIKPANLIVASEGNKSVVKVLDFGLAKVTSEGQVDGRLTREGQMLGTPDYIAPEQIRDAQSADIRADIYSLGCTFYYILTGRPPFRGEHLWDLYQAHFSLEAQPLNLVRPEVPVELAALVAKMMAKEPGRRFQTPGEVAQALTPFFKNGGVAPVGSTSEICQAGQPEVGQSKADAGGVLTQPGMNMESLFVTPPGKPKERAQLGAIPDGLIDLGEQNPLFDTMLDGTPSKAAPEGLTQGHRAWSMSIAKQSGPWARGVWAAAGVLLLGLLVALAVMRVKTSNGVIVLENVPENAVVEIDGQQITITPIGSQPVKIEAQPGKRGVMVKRGDDLLLGQIVTLESGKEFKLTIRLESPVKPEPKEKSPPAEGTSRENEMVVTGVPGVTPAGPRAELPKFEVTDSTRTADKAVRPDAVPAVKPHKRLDSIKNSVGMTLKLIPAGTFLMGSPDDDQDAESDEKPQHRVRITRPFYLGEYEVTQAQYKTVTGNAPSWFSANGGGKERVAGQSTDRHPVEQVSWLDAVKFCNKLGEMESLGAFYDIYGENVRVPDWSRRGYRLPTEAEWEYACRANAPTATRYAFGDGASLDEFGWYGGNSGRKTHPAGEKLPNGLGLFDMHGNVWEHCWDGYGESYYTESLKDDPRGPGRASRQVIRGGGWGHAPRSNRSAYRFGYVPHFRGSDLGFRLALVQSVR